MTDDLTDEERQILINMLAVEIERSRYPLSPRIEALKRIAPSCAASGHHQRRNPMHQPQRESREGRLTRTR